MALFAVLAKKAPVGITAEEFGRLLADGFAYTKNLEDKGVIRHRWICVGANAGLNIYEVGSHEQLMGVLYGSPAGPHLEFDVYPLIDPTAFDPATAGRG
jgi:muconolactone delta-isomerase